MKYFKTHLPKSNFVHIHHSITTPIKQVLYRDYKKEEDQLFLKNEKILEIGNNHYQLLRENLIYKLKIISNSV